MSTMNVTCVFRWLRRYDGDQNSSDATVVEAVVVVDNIIVARDIEHVYTVNIY